MSRLDDLNWNEIKSTLYAEISSCPITTRRDLYKMLDNLAGVAQEVSKLEVIERRTMGSSGLRVNEKVAELEKRIKHINQMIMIARIGN